jgi:actin-related protein
MSNNYNYSDNESDDFTSSPALVIDNGSGMVKAGFAGEAQPCVEFPSIIGIPKYKKSMKHLDNANTTYVGSDAYAKRGVLKLSYPIEHGIVTDWENMEHIWHHTFDQLRVDPSDRNVLLTEAPRNPKRNREKMAEIMFETFNVDGMYIAIQGVLSLYASGRTTGTVLDIGDGVTHTIPIYDGYAIENAIHRFDLAGRDVTEYMQKLLEREGLSMNTSSEKEIVRRMKERYCYCVTDIDAEAHLYKQKNMSRNYTLPDGNAITLNDVMYETPEVLFNPGLIGKEMLGVHEAVNDSIMKSDINIRKDLYSNIVLSGGTTMIKDFDKKLEHELQSIITNKIDVKIVAPRERKYSVWIGGSILAALPSFESAWIYNREYQEAGVSIIHQRCM